MPLRPIPALLRALLLGQCARATGMQPNHLSRRTDVIVNPSTPQIAFFWSSNNDSLREIPQCSNLTITTSANSASSSLPVSPFVFTTAGTGFVPQVQTVPGVVGGNFTWVANLPEGTAFSLAMTDSANNSGGAVSGYSIVKGSSSCTLASNSTAVSFTVNPPNNPCNVTDLVVTGGSKPYTVSVMAGESGRYANASGIQASQIAFGNAVPAGQTFYLFVTDSTGEVSQVSSGMTSGLGQSTCLSPTVPKASTLAPTIGGVVGGVLGVLLLFSIGYWLYRRKKTARAEAAYRQELNSADYRLADGTAPRITPFVLPQKAEEAEYSMVPSHSDHSPYREDTPATSGYGRNGSVSPSFAQSQYPAYPQLSASHPSEYGPSYSPSDHSGYPSYESRGSSEPITDARTGLANPDAFEYRIDAPDPRSLPPPGAGGARSGW